MPSPRPADLFFACVPLVLASASPRRQDFLARLGLQFQVAPADIDETLHADESPEPFARRMAAADVHAAAMAYLEAEGVGDLFTHGLGHGVGLQTHEAPSLGGRSKHILQPGMIVTVEPGLYYPAWGGIRWEYMILVTEDGHKVL